MTSRSCISTRKQIKYFFDANSVVPLQYLAHNMLPERMKELFTVEMWKVFIAQFPHKAKLFDITKVRNQTELRRLILAKPHILRYVTLDDMKNCVIDGPTWVRIITQMNPKKRKHVPAGFVDWAKKDIFK